MAERLGVDKAQSYGSGQVRDGLLATEQRTVHVACLDAGRLIA